MIGGTKANQDRLVARAAARCIAVPVKDRPPCGLQPKDDVHGGDNGQHAYEAVPSVVNRKARREMARKVLRRRGRGSGLAIRMARRELARVLIEKKETEDGDGGGSGGTDDEV